MMKELISAILKKPRSISRKIIKSSLKTIYEREKFLELIRLERDRVNRDDQQFSLILINVKENDKEFSDIIKLIDKISKRVRRIDQIGWYDKNRIGLLLPQTSKAGAEIIANDICQNLDGSNSPIVLETSSYPDETPITL